MLPTSLSHPVMLIPRSVGRGVLEHAAAEHPRECCGILIGRVVENAIRADHAIAARNITAGDAHRAFQLDWTSLQAAWNLARRTELAVVGFYHSHPDGGTEPSSADGAAAWPGLAYVIVGRRGPEPAIRAWRALRGAPDLEPIRLHLSNGANVVDSGGIHPYPDL
ncbi:MAG: M67 family metallopeptidase [Planctomycetes bacterium]|nr:M67 family metallopeptidase [Planctomycetota bacterium]